ncbi:MAG: flavin reductase [Fretibacterium sp.]|nr:flavin reductase [Fretibacterium sp.]
MRKIFAALLALFVLTVEAPVASAELLKFSGSPHLLPAPVMVVGAYTPGGQANFAVFHRGGVLTSGKDGGSMRVSFGVKGDAEKSLTYQSVKASGACTINLPSLKYLSETDLLGSFSGRAPCGCFQDKLKAAGLTAVKGAEVNAPMVEEFPISLECELEDDIAIAPGSKSRLMILKVRKVWADEAYIDAKGKINPMSVSGDPDSSLIFFSHSHAENGGYYGYGSFLGKSGEISKRYREGR